jgi:hypothetical protein
MSEYLRTSVYCVNIIGTTVAVAAHRRALLRLQPRTIFRKGSRAPE